MGVTHSSVTCASCGAVLPARARECAYCGGAVVLHGIHDASTDTQGSLPPGAGEFGRGGMMFATFLIGGTILLYGAGWWFEDTTYWLDTRAMITWTGFLPLWLFLFALLYRDADAPLLVGLGISLVLFLVHLGVMAWIRGGIGNDHAGIAAMVGGSCLGSWLLGRLVHHRVRLARWRNDRANSS